jgi:hypothetical protein
MDRPVGAGGDRSDRNGPGYVGPDLGLVNPSRGPAAGLAERWRQGPGDSDPFSRREARRDHAAGRQVRSTFAGIVCSLRRPACAPRDRALTLCHLLVAQGRCAQIDKMAAGPTYNAGGRRAPAAALLVDPSTRPAWRPSARVPVTGFSAPTGSLERVAVSGWSRSLLKACPRGQTAGGGCVGRALTRGKRARG